MGERLEDIYHEMVTLENTTGLNIDYSQYDYEINKEVKPDLSN